MAVSDRRERELKRREREILEAAVDLFSTESWEEVTIAHIAERAEIGKGTIYKHFASKDELIGRIVLDERRAFFWKLKRAMEPALESPLEAARAVVQTCFERYQSNPKFIQRLDHYMELHDLFEDMGEELAQELRSVNDGMLALFWDSIGMAVQAGTFSSGDRALRIAVAWAVVDGAQRLISRAGSAKLIEGRLEAFRDEVAAFILRGMGWKDES